MPILLLAPALAIVLTVVLYPIYYGIDISLHKTRFLEKGAFVGLSTYGSLFRESEFILAIRTSLMYAVGSLVLTSVIGMALALLLNRPIRFRPVFRTILIIPWTLSQAVTASLWLWLLNPTYGPLKYLLSQVGAHEVVLLSNPHWALPIVILVNTWMSYPFPMILYLAALQTVPEEVIEAARIDGCSTWASFWRVTLPSIRATILSTSILLTLQFLNMVTLIYV
ncbi:MAG: sugar ABC transporter permease, partial [Planctomycetes bacterium]|nr:sugar ABC transporter permease [Planctomycetota bacterium]